MGTNSNQEELGKDHAWAESVWQLFLWLDVENEMLSFIQRRNGVSVNLVGFNQDFKVYS